MSNAEYASLIGRESQRRDNAHAAYLQMTERLHMALRDGIRRRPLRLLLAEVDHAREEWVDLAADVVRLKAQEYDRVHNGREEA